MKLERLIQKILHKNEISLNVTEAKAFFSNFGLDIHEMHLPMLEDSYFHKEFKYLNMQIVHMGNDLKAIILTGDYIAKPKDYYKKDGIWQPGFPNAYEIYETIILDKPA